MIRCPSLWWCSTLISGAHIPTFSPSDKCPARCALFSIFALISANVLFADFQHHCQSFKLGQRSQNSSQLCTFLYLRLSWRDPASLFHPDFLPDAWSLECWAHCSWMDYFRRRGMQLQGFTGPGLRVSCRFSCFDLLT